jgi:hypothetical protein
MEAANLPEASVSIYIYIYIYNIYMCVCVCVCVYGTITQKVRTFFNTTEKLKSQIKLYP